jgi:hypothetical protein
LFIKQLLISVGCALLCKNYLQLLGGWLWQWLCYMLRGTCHTAATGAPVAAAAAAAGATKFIATTTTINSSRM